MSEISGQFLGEVPEYRPRSTLEELFEEEPVGLKTFIQDKKFLGADWMLSDRQAQLVRITERIYLKDLYPLMSKEFGGYWSEILPMKNLIAAQWGKGGGKDSTVRVAALRVAYLLMCLRSPQRYFGMPEDDSIHMLNIAANSQQAHRAFFEPMTKMVNRGWFKDRSEPKRDSIVYDKNLTAISGHSDAESQEGLNIILGIADEIDAFKAKGEMIGQGNKAREASTSAESILNMIKTSASTRFPENYKRIAISYPRYLGSTIQQLTSEAKKDIAEVGDEKSIYFASGPYATWEVNPRIKGKEDFASDYRTDPDEAAAKYECKPTRATDAYFRNPVIFRQAVDQAEQPVSVSYRLTETATLQDPDKRVRGWEPVFTFQPDFRVVPGARYAIHADLAIKGDRAGVAMSHIERWEERELVSVGDDGYVTRQQTVVPILRNDFTIYFEADIAATDPLTIDPDTGKEKVLAREIQIRWVRDLIYQLIQKDFYIGLVTYDGFQSADSIQILESHGISTNKVSTDRDPDIWKSLKDIASESRIRMPYNELLINELESLSRLQNGKVDHPPGGSKDLADAFSCSLVGALTLGGEEDTDSPFVEGGEELFFFGGQTESMFGQTQQNFGGKLDLPFGMTEALRGGGSFYAR